jgi:hypothetical protein
VGEETDAVQRDIQFKRTGGVEGGGANRRHSDSSTVVFDADGEDGRSPCSRLKLPAALRTHRAPKAFKRVQHRIDAEPFRKVLIWLRLPWLGVREQVRDSCRREGSGTVVYRDAG